jgi:hypothetical protein
LEVIARECHMAEGSNQQDTERTVLVWEEGAILHGFDVGIIGGPVDDARICRSGIV